MQKTLIATIMACSSIVTFAQTTPVTTTKPAAPASPTATSSTTTSSPASTSPATTAPMTTTPQATSPMSSTPTTNSSVTNSTTDPMSTTTNQQVNTTMNSSNWNPTSSNAANPPSTSWEPGTSSSWGWNSYGIWNSSAPLNNNTTNNNTTSANTSGLMDVNSNNAGVGMNHELNSGGSYNAYNGTAVSALPYNVKNNFSKDYSTTSNSQYTWNQYGDWFTTHYTNNGRMTQYFYDDRGRGYSLSLPVIQTYVPEDIIDKALQKYGSHLYSISMVKTADGNNAYQMGLLDRGQLHNEYLNEGGSSVAGVWRTEEMNMTSTSVNAAMDDHNSVNKNDVNATTASSDVSIYQDTAGKPKMKMRTKNSDGSTTVTKAKNGKMKTKTKGRKAMADSTMSPSGVKEQ